MLFGAFLKKTKNINDVRFHTQINCFLDVSLRVFLPQQADMPWYTVQSVVKLNSLTYLNTGDTGAGKSTLVNLLVGLRILPTSALQCTATVCELRKSKVRAIVLHYRDETRSKRLECQDESQVQGFTESLAKYVTETDPNTDESPYTRVEIYWPFPLMEVGCGVSPLFLLCGDVHG